jgi:PTH1 family peptidyl-tRNA hydrolase
VDIKAILGLGNPGNQFTYTRHNIGFRIVDQLAERAGGQWRKKDTMELAEIALNDKKVLLIKPQTFMNDSGKVIPCLAKQGIKPENILVVHDELELPFGTIKHKLGGSAKGHNGLKSIMTYSGDGFYRLRFGIGRPESREEVSNYVLSAFAQNTETIFSAIDKASDIIEDFFA